jgi:hypothetical protein
MDSDDLILKQVVENSKERIVWGLRQIFIVFTGTIAIICFIVILGFLIRMYIDQIIMGDIVGMPESYIYGLIFVVLVSFLWTVQTLIWYYKNNYQW